MLAQAVDALMAPGGPERECATYVDATFGRGGHSRAILQRLGPQGRLIAFDKDPEALAEAGRIHDSRFSIRHQGFAALGELPEGSVSGGLLMDLGVSSPQIDNPARGFSFRADGPLDMRMDNTRGPSVADWLAQADEAHIAQVVRDFGEERFARAVAGAIVARRKTRPFTRTADLAETVAAAVKTREPGQHPATRTFQALRIFINGELDELQAALQAGLRVLAPGARLAVISFHSLEDRIVKQFIATHSRQEVDRRAPFAPPRPLPLRALGRERASAAEVAANPRARSAILRVAERTAEQAAA